MTFTMLFSKHASPEAIRAELRKARWAVIVAQKHVHSLECLLERREMEIADGSWPANAQVASAESMTEAQLARYVEAHDGPNGAYARARAAEAQRDTLAKAARLVIARRDSLSVYDVEHALDALAAALAEVAPPEEET